MEPFLLIISDCKSNDVTVYLKHLEASYPVARRILTIIQVRTQPSHLDYSKNLKPAFFTFYYSVHTTVYPKYTNLLNT